MASRKAPKKPLFHPLGQKREGDPVRLPSTTAGFGAPLAHPQFLSKRSPLPARVRKEKGGAYGIQAGKIRIIILRQFIIPWTGPVRGKFAGGDGIAKFPP